MARLALHANRAAVSVHDKFDNAQAQTAAAGVSDKAAIHLIEAAENSLLLARRDADAIVFHRKHNAGIFAIRANRDSLAAGCVGRVLPGVVQQIAQNGYQCVFIRPYPRQVGRDQHTKRTRVCAHRGFNRARRVHIREFESLAITLQPRERQKVLNETAEPKVLTGDQPEILASLRHIDMFVRKQRVHQHPNRCNGSLQLVRNRRDQIRFEPRDSPLPAQRLTSHQRADRDHGNGQ